MHGLGRCRDQLLDDFLARRVRTIGAGVLCNRVIYEVVEKTPVKDGSGFNYAFNPNLSIHGGYGIYYDRITLEM